MDATTRKSTTWYVRFGVKAVAPLLSNVLKLLPNTYLSQIEELQLVRYAGATQGFSFHLDALRRQAATAAAGGQRVGTVLLYLDDCDGGYTVFKDLEGHDGRRLTVKPQRGRALIFFPAVTGETALGDTGDFGDVYDDNTKSDLRTLHAGSPPAANTRKHIAQLWIHASPHTPVVFGSPSLNTHKAAHEHIRDYTFG